MREATTNGTRPAYTLQLDIRNYFMSIDKPRLFEMVAAKLNPHRPADEEALWLGEKLVFHDCTHEPVLKGDPRLVDRLPAHKTLFRAPPGKGLPIGNLNSQLLFRFVRHLPGRRHGAAHGTGRRAGVGQASGEVGWHQFGPQKAVSATTAFAVAATVLPRSARVAPPQHAPPEAC